jgi:hypothetical protein
MLLKSPSAWIPLVLSFAVILMWNIFIWVSGSPIPQPDEGIGAHLFQIWLLLEFLLVAFFAIKWIPRKPNEALLILGLQVLGVVAGCFPVFYFHL